MLSLGGYPPAGGFARRARRLALLLACASPLLAAQPALAAPQLVIGNVGAPTVVGNGQGKRAIWVNAGTVGGQAIDIVGVITTATLDHTWTTTANRPSITSAGQDNIFIEWHIYRAGTYDINTGNGGVPVVADVHVQFNDVDGPNNERVYLPVCSGEIRWVRMDRQATTGRAFGTVAGRPEIFSLIGDQNYNSQPESGVEAYWPDHSSFSMGRTANSGFFIRLDNHSYSDFETLDFECADFAPPVAADDSQEGTPGTPTNLAILANDSASLRNDNPPNNNSLAASEFSRASVNLIAPPGATDIVTGSRGTVIGLTVPNEGVWSYSETTGLLTFTPDPSFRGYATQIRYTVQSALGVTSNQATVTVWYPAIGVVKSSVFNDTNGDGFGQVGERVDYTYRVTAYGAEALRNVTLTETSFSGAGTRPVPVRQSGDTNGDNRLDLTETWIFTASYVLVAADLVSGVSNQATGQGSTSSNVTVTDLSDSLNPGDGNGVGTAGPGPGNGDPTTTRPATAPISAANDTQSGPITSTGQANAFNVLPNDRLKGVAPTPSTVTITQVSTSNAGVTLDPATGNVSVAAGTPAGTHTLNYRICEIGNPGNCATANATVTVAAATPIDAVDDTAPAVTARSGRANVINVLTNDRLNNAAISGGAVVLTLVTPASNPGITLDTATGNVSVAAGTPAGSYTLGYRICETANPGNCDTATVSVTVNPTPIAANADGGGPVDGGAGNANLLNALTNDRLDGAAIPAGAVTLSVVTPATPAQAGASVPTLNTSNGVVSVPAGTPAGNYSIVYRICETASPGNCATATINVAVAAPAIVARNDAAGPVAGRTGGANLIDVLTNDTLGGSAATLATVTLAVTAPAANAGVTLNTGDGRVSVAAGTPAGNYTIGYRICDRGNPTSCANASVQVAVTAASIAAGNDRAGPVNGGTGGSNVANVLGNDSLGGTPVDPADVILSIVTPPENSGIALDLATGRISVAPGTPPGDYLLRYRLCERQNPTNCAEANVAVSVVVTAMTAADDNPPGVGGRGGSPAVVNVLSNDSVGGQPATPSNVTLSIVNPATPARPGAPVPTLDPATGNVAVPAATPAGTYEITYRICETADPSNCRTARATIIVLAAPIAAAADNPAPVRPGATGVVNVYGNDRLDGTPIDPADIIGSVVSPATPARPGAPVPALNPATGLIDVPAGTPAGSYTITYRICERLNPGNCAEASVTITVSAPAIVAVNDAPPPVSGRAGAPNVVNAFANDTLDGAPIDPAAIVARLTGPAPAGIDFDAGTGNVSVAAGTPAGSYTLNYEICERQNPTNCATARIVVEVRPATIAASNDSGGTVPGDSGRANVIDVLANDRLDGAAPDLSAITLRVTTVADHPGVSLDIATGFVSVAARTPAGMYELGYTICERLNPANCASAVARVTVAAAPIAARDDQGSPVRSGVGGGNVAQAYGNDLLGGTPVAASDIVGRAVSVPHPGIGFDPATGIVSVSAAVPAGDYVLRYEICERLNPTNCAQANVAITVTAPQGNIAGTVYSDLDGDRQVGPNEPRRANWTVELIRGGVVIATTRTGPDGRYTFENVPSGPDYEIVFRAADNNVVYAVRRDVTVGVNTTADQNLPIDPSGVVYNSITRQPIAGARVRLTGRDGTSLPAACYIDASQADQLTGAAGEYRFDIRPGAAPACPAGETEYLISVAPPAGFSGPSTVLPPEPGSFDPTGRPAPVRLSPSPAPPAGDPVPPYYVSLRLQAGDPDVLNNHIAIDPFTTRPPLIVTKTSITRSASVGDLVNYEITVRNPESSRRAGVSVVDILPPGMTYVLGSARVNGARAEPVRGDRQLLWSGQVIPANGSVRYNLTLAVGAGVTGGDRVNTGLARDGAGTEISNRGTATIRIAPSGVFDCTELIGKVYEDTNGNDRQDEGEPGIPGARVITVNGLIVTADNFGRYHIACAAVPDAEIGSNFVLKLDPDSLPIGWRSTSENPRVIRLTRGLTGELNFGAAPGDAISIRPLNRRRGE